jgi:hypothetical protein
VSPLARMELERYNRIRKEAKKRDRQFAPRNADTGFALGVALGIVAIALMGALWLVTRA